MEKLKVGIIGVGKISSIYLENLTGMFLDFVSVTAVADILPERATGVAEAYGIPSAQTPGELLANTNVDLVLNLTTPESHFDICRKALEAGKHVYVEKPLSAEMDEARQLLTLAEEKGLRIGGSPDTFLGAGIQTCRKLIDDGWIGRPVAALAFMMNHGHEHWHPAPEFYYKKGAGPMFDMGPYYLTALVNLLGPVSELNGSVSQASDTRTILSQPLKGKSVKVEVPTHVAGIMNFAGGAVGTIVTSFDVWSHSMPFIEIYGTEGSIKVPDPNTFGGPVFIRRFRNEEWSEIPLSHTYETNSRGLGLADLAVSLTGERPHRASGELTSHVLELMHGFHISADAGSRYSVTSTCARPQVMERRGII